MSSEQEGRAVDATRQQGHQFQMVNECTLYLITDGDQWIRVTADQLDALLKAKLIHACMGECPCHPTYHPMTTWAAIDAVMNKE